MLRAIRTEATGSYGRTVGAWDTNPSTLGDRHFAVSHATSNPCFAVVFDPQHELPRRAVGLTDDLVGNEQQHPSAAWPVVPHLQPCDSQTGTPRTVRGAGKPMAAMAWSNTSAKQSMFRVASRAGFSRRNRIARRAEAGSTSLEEL